MAAAEVDTAGKILPRAGMFQDLKLYTLTISR
jgi:hypothetical protein